ncbi:MAG: hypothetical protein AABZ44_10750, partial [Elusimicrobiota bacterium]
MTAGSLEAMRSESEAKIALKAEAAAKLKQELAHKEQELAMLSGAMENEKNVALTRQRIELEGRQRAGKELLAKLEAELSSAQLRIQEVSKIIEAKKGWMEAEKLRRLESIKNLVGDLESQAQACHAKIEQEKAFWRQHTSVLEKQIESLNVKLVTAQAQITALERRRQQYLVTLSEQHARQIKEHKEGVVHTMRQGKSDLEAAHQQIAELLADYEGFKQKNQVEIAASQVQAARRQEVLSIELATQEDELKRLREEYAAVIAAKTADLEELRAHYQKTVLSPALEAKQVHLSRLRAAQKELDDKIAEVGAASLLQRQRLTTELDSAQSRVKELKEQLLILTQEQRRNLKSLEDEIAEKRAPMMARLGQLEKAIEIAKANQRQQLEALETQKNNLGMEVGRERLRFEAEAEEKRKTFMFAIADLRSRLQAMLQRDEKSKVEMQRAIEAAHKERQDIEIRLKEYRELAQRKAGERGSELERLLKESKEKESLLVVKAADLQEEFELKQKKVQEEIAALKLQAEGQVAALQSAWQHEELESEKQKITLTDQINSRSEASTKQTETLNADYAAVKEKVNYLEEQMQRQLQQDLAAEDEFRQQRGKLLEPIEKRLAELEAQKQQIEKTSRGMLDGLNAQAAEVRQDIKNRQHLHDKEVTGRRQDCLKQVEALREKLDKAKVVHESAIASLGKEKAVLEEKMVRLEQQLAERRCQFQKKCEELKKESAERKDKLARQVSRAEGFIDKLRVNMERVSSAKGDQVTALEREMETAQMRHQEALVALNVSYEREIKELQGSLGAQVKQKEALLAELAAQCQDFSKRIADANADLDRYRKNMEIEAAQVEHRRNKEVLQVRNERQQLANELVRARRAFIDAVSEAKRDKELARLKVDMRLHRFEETLQGRREEIEGLKRELGQRVAQKLESLTQRLDALGLQRRAQLEEVDTIESRKEGLAQKQAQSASSSAKRRDTVAKEKALQKLSVCRQRFQELIEVQAKEQRKLTDLAGSVEPIAEVIRGPMAKLILDWEQEMRRLENLIKALEESPFWRQ